MHTRKNVHRLTSVWVAVCILLVSLVSPYQVLKVQADTYSGYFKYVTLGDDTIKITGLSSTGVQAVKSEESMYIPSKLDGKPVVAIGDQSLCIVDLIGYFKQVIISEGITFIGHSAFHGLSNLTSVTLPDSLTFLGDGCFADTNLSDIVIPGSVKIGGDGAFDACQNLKSITLKDGMEEIGSKMFRNNSSLTRIAWPESSLKRIDSQAFAYCTSLQEVSLPSSVMELGSGVFQGCTALKKLTLSADLVIMGENAIPDQEDLKIVVPEELTDISHLGLESLVHVSIYVVEGGAAELYLRQQNVNNYYTYPAESQPEKSKEPGNTNVPEETKAPENMEEPAETKAPEKTKEPEETEAPENTKEPEGTEAPENTKAPEGTEATENTKAPEGTETPENTKEPEGTEAPENTKAPEGTKAPENTSEPGNTKDPVATKQPVNTGHAETPTPTSKTAISKGSMFSVKHQKYQVLTDKTVAFIGCTNRNVKLVKIPSTVQWKSRQYKVTTIAKNACKGYSKLKKVTIGNQVKSVGNAAFMNCKKLYYISYGKSVSVIGKNGLRGDRSLQAVIIKSKKLKSVGKAAFRNVPAALVVKVPKKQIKRYKILIQKAK